jgi:hypothetical protein
MLGNRHLVEFNDILLSVYLVLLSKFARNAGKCLYMRVYSRFEPPSTQKANICVSTTAVGPLTAGRQSHAEGQQTEGNFPPLRRWNPQPHMNENQESPPANLASSEGATQSDTATNVRAADIAEARVLIDMFVNGEQLPVNVTV